MNNKENICPWKFRTRSFSRLQHLQWCLRWHKSHSMHLYASSHRIRNIYVTMVVPLKFRSRLPSTTFAFIAIRWKINVLAFTFTLTLIVSEISTFKNVVFWKWMPRQEWEERDFRHSNSDDVFYVDVLITRIFYVFYVFYVGVLTTRIFYVFYVFYVGVLITRKLVYLATYIHANLDTHK